MSRQHAEHLYLRALQPYRKAKQELQRERGFKGGLWVLVTAIVNLMLVTQSQKISENISLLGG